MQSQIGCGFEFRENCNNTIIHDNNLRKNTCGIILLTTQTSEGLGNIVYQNNFVNNTQNVSTQNYPYNGTDIKNGITTKVSWNNGKVGNYWSDYNGQGVYVIDQSNIDYHPILQQVNIAAQQPTTNVPLLTIAIIGVSALIIVAILILTLIRYRIKKK